MIALPKLCFSDKTKTLFQKTKQNKNQSEKVICPCDLDASIKMQHASLNRKKINKHKKINMPLYI